MPLQAMRYAGRRPAAYGLTSVISRRVLSRIQPLTAPAGATMRRAGSSVNINPLPTKPGRSVLSTAKTIAGGEVHQIEPIQLRFTMGQRWLGFALVGLLAFSFFRK